jgi:hypothetical protein
MAARGFKRRKRLCMHANWDAWLLGYSLADRRRHCTDWAFDPDQPIHIGGRVSQRSKPEHNTPVRIKHLL